MSPKITPRRVCAFRRLALGGTTALAVVARRWVRLDALARVYAGARRDADRGAS